MMKVIFQASRQKTSVKAITKENKEKMLEFGSRLLKHKTVLNPCAEIFTDCTTGQEGLKGIRRSISLVKMITLMKNSYAFRTLP